MRGRKTGGGLCFVCLLVGLALLPAHASAFSKAIWGQVSRGGVDQFPLYHRLGVGIYEADLAWSQVAPTRPHDATNPRDPAYHWPADLARALREARHYHMRVLFQIGTTPAWANGRRGTTWVPNHVSDFAAFAKAAAREYPSVRLWMVWGEPDNQRDFQPLTPTRAADFGSPLTPQQQVAPHNYARLLDAAYGAIKGVSRSNLVIGGSSWTFGDIDTYDWVRNLRLPNGRPPRMDMYAHNPFTERDPNFTNTPLLDGAYDFSDLRRLATLLDQNLKKGLPLFLSEWTIPTAPDREFGFWVEPPTAAHWITDALRLSRHWRRIYALGWIHVYDNSVSTGGLLTAAGKPKPLFYAFSH